MIRARCTAHWSFCSSRIAPTDDRRLVGEDADDLGAPLDLQKLRPPHHSQQFADIETQRSPSADH
jgi:hypothetical protein